MEVTERGGPGRPLAAATERRVRRRFGIKRFLPRTLFGRSLMIILTPVLLMQVTAAYYFYDRHWDTLTSRLAEGVVGEIAMVMEQLDEAAGNRTQQAIILDRATRTLDLIMSVDPDVSVLVEQPPAPNQILRSRLSDALRERIGRPFHIDPEVAGEWSIITVLLNEGALKTLVPRRRLFSSTSQVFISWMVGSGVILVAVAIIFMRNQIRPIRRLAIAAESFGKGRDVPNFKPEGATEVRQAAHAFLIMRERIQRQIAQRTEMLAGVSHDLRTPLTRMKLLLAMLGDGPETEELRADVADMEDMIEAYLAFARGEGGEELQPTDLEVLLGEVVGAARREGAIISLSVRDTMMLPLRPQAFKRCLANVIGNARRYAHRIDVSAGRRGTAFEIVIDDDGPGIPPEERDAVFKPFYRMEASRNQQTGGTGLGLTIARDIARSHGGDIRLADSPLGGLRCIVRMPL